MPFISERKGSRTLSSNGPIDQSALAADSPVNRTTPDAVTPASLSAVTPVVTPVVTPINQEVSPGHQGASQ